MVVVAVDPRWLRQALEQHHATLFLAGDRGEEWQTSPTDYLDKIFQIPYALRPIGERAGEYIRSLLPEAVQQMPVPVVSPPPPAATTTEATATEKRPMPAVPKEPNVDLHTPMEKLDTLTPGEKAKRFTESNRRGFGSVRLSESSYPSLGRCC